MQLAQDVVVNGKVALPREQRFPGTLKLRNALTLPPVRKALTVNISDAHVHGQTVAIKTTGAVSLENPMAQNNTTWSSGLDL